MLHRLARLSVSSSASVTLSESDPSNPVPTQPVPTYAGAFLNLQLWIGWYCSTQPINTHTDQNVQEMRSFMRAFFSVPSTRVNCAILQIIKLLPFRNLYLGLHDMHSSPFSTTEQAFVLIVRKKMFRIKFLSLASLCVELVRSDATYQYDSQLAGCEALSAVSLYTDAVSGLDLDPNEPTRHTF